MSEPVIRWEYRLRDGKGQRIKATPAMIIRADEAESGVVGLLKWSQRVRKLDDEIDNSTIRSYIMEPGEKKTPLLELEMWYEDGGYYQFRGMFPNVII